MMDEYIEIDKNEIPYAFEMELAGEIFEFEVNYNQAHDFFTLDLFKNGGALVVGEKLILNRPLFRNRIDIQLPKVQIIPLDRANSATRITYENLNETVFLYVNEGEENE
ncbi:phage baseplate plug family protein [Lysinibacillus sp. NPDC047702]|uniref:phage baseplate plug family protein n=1 Tax=unclassified Lysinibacillus TaxID=2636778 RepID=UPI003D045AEF